MKRLFLVLLLVGILFFGGCVQTQSDQKAIELSNSTTEGKLASTLNDVLKQTANCSAGDYQGIANLANPIIQSAGIGVSLPTDDAKAKELVADAIECNAQLPQAISEIEKDKKYKISYSLTVNNSCKYAELKNAAIAYKLSIDVDLEANTAIVKEGKLKPEVEQQTASFQPAFAFTGKCTAPVLLGVGLFGQFLGTGSQTPNENPNENGNSGDENAIENENPNDSKIAYDFDAWWDDATQNPIQLSWGHNEQENPYYVALEMWTSGNSSPLGSIESTIQKLKEDNGMPVGHVFGYADDFGEIYYGGNLSYPHQFKISAYLLDSEYNIVEKFGYKEFSINAPVLPSATDIVSDFEAQWDAEDTQNPLKFTWSYGAESGKYYVALDMWNTGNSGPLGSIDSTIQNLKNGSPFPPSHVYDAETESGNLYWGGNYTYPDVFKIHAYLLNETYDNLGEIAYVQITRNNAEESPTSEPI